MTRSIWQVTIDTEDDVLSSKVFFETKQQADEYIAMVQEHPDIMLGLDIEDCMDSHWICTAQPMPLQDNEFIKEFQKLIDEKVKKEAKAV